MQIDLDHLHYWMCAIRESVDTKRTLDAFWKGQISSKEWLIENLKPFVKEPVSIDIHGGWVGVLSSLLFQSGIPIKHIRSIDIDPSCKSIATMMNKGEEMTGMFEAVTADMCEISSDADIIINTSCEHISKQQYEIWLSRLPASSLIILQSNNYYDLEEHVNCVDNVNQLLDFSLLNVEYSDTLKLSMYDRFMIIGKKHV